MTNGRFKLPSAAAKRTPGKYELTTPRQNQFGSDCVKAFLYIPASAEKKAPLVIFYHGMAPGQMEIYKNAFGDLLKWADERKFIVLSVQNMWGLFPMRIAPHR